MTRPQMLLGKWELPLLAAVLTLATVLRVGWPRLTEFKFSEARLEALALELTREGRVPLVGVPSSAGFDHSPISVYLYVPAFLFSTNPLYATVYGGLMGVAAVGLCWWLGRRWPGGGALAALVAALLFAVSPWSVAFSRKIWQVTFVPLLTLTFVGLAVSALVPDEPDPSRSRRQAWLLSWSLVVYALLVQVHPSAVSLAPALLLWLVVFWRRVKLGPLLVGVVLAALTAVPFLVHQVQSGWPALHALTSQPPASNDLSALRLAWEAITGRSIHSLAGDAYPLLRVVPQLGAAFNLVGWLVLAACLALLGRMVVGWRAGVAPKRQAAQVDLILLSWLVLPIALNVRHSLDLHLHFFALVAPAAFLIVGRGAEFALSTAQALVASKPWGRALTMLSAFGLALLAAAQVTSLMLMAQFVATHSTPGGFGTPLGTYLDLEQKTIDVVVSTAATEVLIVGEGDSAAVDGHPAIFDVLLRDKVRYRFVDGGSAAVFPPQPAVALVSPEPGEAARWYEPWPTQELPGGYRLVELDGSWPQARLKAIDSPRLFENGIELQGYAWESIQEARGRFWLLWQALWLNPEDTHFSVSLLDQEGQMWGQEDSAGYPVEYRQKGDRVISLFDIIRTDADPTDPASARLGLYFYPEVVSVPVIDGAGNPVGEAVTVESLGREP